MWVYPITSIQLPGKSERKSMGSLLSPQFISLFYYITLEKAVMAKLREKLAMLSSNGGNLLHHQSCHVEEKQHCNIGRKNNENGNQE